MPAYSDRIFPDVQAELDTAAAAEARGHFHTAFEHLERAHVLGQASTVLHVRVHWHMLRFALRQRLTGEAFGQLWRVVAAAVFTPFGLVPPGNTGGANVSGFRRLPVPPDLRAAIGSARGSTARGPAGGTKRALSVVAAIAAVTTVTLLATGCMTPPTDLDLALDKKSAAGTYQVALLPPAQAPAINQLHSWRVRLTTPQGAPVPGARFAVDGGMPQHGHGLPTQPRVTRELETGTYQIDGMKFSMTGWWEIKLAIQGAQGDDKVTFNTVVATPGARP